MAVLSVDEYRIIPTRVGTSRPRPALLQGVGDHPHACGDKFTAMEQDEFLTRIIPTRVGTRLSLV